MSLAKEINERIVQLSQVHPAESARTLDAYGWDKAKDSTKFTHEKFPKHVMEVTPDHVEHTHHGISAKVSHDDFQKYLRGLHTKAYGYKDHEWVQDDEGDD
jgi:hypothetical protein